MKMKNVIFVFVVCIMMNGCSKEENFNKNITESSVVSSDIIWFIQDNNIVYSNYEENFLVFYSYNSEDNKCTKLGEIENPYIYSGDFSVIRKENYFYCNELVVEDNAEKLVHSMYKIDMENQMLTEVLSDDSEQTLIYIEAVDDKVFSLKGRLEGNQAITYLDFVDISDEKLQYFDFISKQYDNQKNRGEVIYQFSSYDGYLYVLVNSTMEALCNWKIEKYDVNGKYISEYILDNEISKNINDDMVSEFEILGKYGFIRNFSGNGVLFELSDSGTKAIFEEIDLDIANYKENSFVSEKIVLFSRGLQKMWIFDTCNEKLGSVDWQGATFKCILMDDEEQMVVWGNDISYWNIDKLVSGHENLIIRQ